MGLDRGKVVLLGREGTMIRVMVKEVDGAEVVVDTDAVEGVLDEAEVAMEEDEEEGGGRTIGCLVVGMSDLQCPLLLALMSVSFLHSDGEFRLVKWSSDRIHGNGLAS